MKVAQARRYNGWEGSKVSPGWHILCELLLSPHSQLLAEDLGVVADIDGELGVVQEVGDGGCLFVDGGQSADFGKQLIAVGWRGDALIEPGFDDDHRPLLPAQANADERGAED